MATVGFDFGTHQTKICYEDRRDKNNPRYSFFKFHDLEGNEQLALPSVVQINEDDTLSYGFIDETRCKCIVNSIPKPKEPQKPELVYPSKPQSPVMPKKPASSKVDWKDKLLFATGKKENPEDEWKKECQKIKKKYEFALRDWKGKCDILEKKYQKDLATYNTHYTIYQERLKEWEEKMNVKRRMIFRYFKQSTFNNTPWQYPIEATRLSVWYVAYILFDLNKQYGNLYRTQFGIPTGNENLKYKKEKAVSILLTAFDLVEKVFKNDKDKFLSTKYEDLIKLTNWHPYSDKEKKAMGIYIFPEAYASLLSLTTKNRLEGGFDLMVDIGGGTTDVSFFIIDYDIHNSNSKPKPLIYNYFSINKGINYIVESAMGKSFANGDKFYTLDSKELDSQKLKAAKFEYFKDLQSYCHRLMNKLYSTFAQTGRSSGDLTRALNNRPIIYNGGGSTFHEMRRGFMSFNQVQHLNGYYWKGMFIEDMDKLVKKGLCPILSVALGLSVQPPIDTDDIKIENLNTIFDHISKENEDLSNYSSDYDLLDT